MPDMTSQNPSTNAEPSDARYIIRMDDACETMHRDKWGAIEAILDRNGICPIVAVIPKNEDPTLRYMDTDPSFWEKVRSWEHKGWQIALHGYTHVYHYVSKRKLILPFYDRSEFAGRSLQDQIERISKGVEIFRSQSIDPQYWIAPSHSFDEYTLKALTEASNIKVISDGIALTPFAKAGFTFIPQQLWWPLVKKSGIWTICLHPDTMSGDEISAFERELSKPFYAGKFITAESVANTDRKQSIGDHLFSALFWAKWNTRKVISKIKK